MIYIILLALFVAVIYGIVIYLDTRDTNERINKTKSTKKKHSKNECYIKD